MHPPTFSFSTLEEGLEENWRKTFYQVGSERTWDHGFKLKEGLFMLYIWLGHLLKQNWQDTGEGEPEMLWMPHH